MKNLVQKVTVKSSNFPYYIFFLCIKLKKYPVSTWTGCHLFNCASMTNKNIHEKSHVPMLGFFSWKLQNTKMPGFDFDRAPFPCFQIIIAYIHRHWEIKMSGENFRLCWFSFFLETSIWQNNLYRFRKGAILIYFHVSIRIARIHLWEIIKNNKC